jgi:hypothetical protein
MKRQAGPTRWLGDYQPANMIGDADCPRQTRPSSLCDPCLKRCLQAQAGTERPFILLALHNPNLLDLHEQKMLFFSPAPHPLSNHIAARGMQLPSLRGTLAIAAAMGQLNRHALVRAPKDHPILCGKMVPFPYIGDVLAYLKDAEGPYAVNWSIKAVPEDFHRTYKRKRMPPTKEDQERAEFRHEIERLYYLDGRIPTHHLVPTLIDSDLSINLLNLYYWYARTPIDDRATNIYGEIVDWYREQLPLGRLMYDHAKDAAKKFGIQIYDAKWALKTAIFNRQLRVELFCVVADNLSLLPELNDPFERYADWFRRLS